MVPPLDKRKFELGANEDRNLSLLSILRREQEYWADIWHLIEDHKEKVAKIKEQGGNPETI